MSECYSVLMSVYYKEKPEFLISSMESMFHQTIPPDDFVLVCNGPLTDELELVIKKMQEKYKVLNVVRLKEDGGLPRALNKGLDQCKYDYIARMDSDDIAHPDRIEKEVGYLQSHKDVDVVGGRVNIINQIGEVISHRWYPSGGRILSLYAGLRNPMPHPTVMMRRRVVDDGVRYDDNIKMSEDLDLWLRMLNHGYKLANIKDVVLDYRVNNGLGVKRTGREQIEFLALVRKRNFDKNYIFRSILSWCTAEMYLHMPVKLIRDFYKVFYKQEKGNSLDINTTADS